MKPNKKVYIFGAGASAAAKIPIQNQLLSCIYQINYLDYLPKYNQDSIFDELPENTISLVSYNDFDEKRKELGMFILNNFSKNQVYKKPEELSDTDTLQLYKEVQNLNISLEDLFTIIDKAHLLKEYFITYSPEELTRIQNCLSNCIIFTLELFLQKSKPVELYKKVANYFLQYRLNFTQEEDPFSIITLNWDTLLDSYLDEACSEYNKIHNKEIIRPDYCFYNYDLNKMVPSLHIKAQGKYDIKLMKLHGSINWLLCNNCGRIFTDFSTDIAYLNFDKTKTKYRNCTYCTMPSKNSELHSLLITPTFLKDFNNLHLKTIWHNAYLDLCEATEVVFIGYSLPDADFELRYILKRALDKNTKIRIVLHFSDNPEIYNESLLALDDAKGKIKRKDINNRLNLPEYRYKNLFGNHEIIASYDGIEEYFNSINKE